MALHRILPIPALGLLLAATPSGLAGQQAGTPEAHGGHAATSTPVRKPHEMKPVNPADVASPEALVAAFYASASGTVGQERDNGRFSSLFYPGAQIMPVEGKGHGAHMPRSFPPSAYLANTDLFAAEQGYVVKEIARRTVRFGKIAQVFSTYEGRHATADAKPFVRGINSFQFLFDGARWWILSLAMQPETPALSLPKELLLVGK